MRAKTKAARLQTINTPAVENSMTMRLLRSIIQNEGVDKIWPKFSQCGGMGRV